MIDLDKTKENIGLNDIDRQTKKELFNKFVDAGGEIVNEKKVKPMVMDRNKQKEYQQRMDSQGRRTPQQNDKSKNGSSISKTASKTKQKDDAISLFIDRLRVKFRL
jgi:hypothetical protein